MKGFYCGWLHDIDLLPLIFEDVLKEKLGVIAIHYDRRPRIGLHERVKKGFDRVLGFALMFYCAKMFAVQ